MGKIQNLLNPEKPSLRTLRTFTPKQFQRLFHLKHHQAHLFLEKYTDRGYFTRLKKGLYTLRHTHPTPLYLANQLYKPSYISFETALRFHQIMPPDNNLPLEIPSNFLETDKHPPTTKTNPKTAPNLILSATAKHSNNFQTQITLFEFHTIPQTAYKGHERIAVDGLPVRMAKPEKAFVDLLYYVNLGKKTFPHRLNPRKLDRRKTLHYARLFNRPVLIKFAEQFFRQNTKKS